MHLRLLFVLLLFASVVVTPPAFGAPRDKAANDKIDQAINQHYLATEFDQAEALLLGTVQACADKCSNSVKAKAWMYVGVVRGSGKEDQAGALEAFQQAVALDPNVPLDEALATPATKQTFQQVSPAAGAPATAAPRGAWGGAATRDAADRGASSDRGSAARRGRRDAVYAAGARGGDAASCPGFLQHPGDQRRREDSSTRRSTTPSGRA